MQHFPISEKLYLTRIPVAAALSEVPKHEPTNHIWFVDRSGSMWHLLPELIDQLKETLNYIPFGDSLTFGYFSSEGLYHIVFKGMIVNSAKDIDRIAKMLDEHKRSLSMTCFSEILTEADQIIKDLSFISKRTALWFLTDGYPVVSNYKREVAAIQTALNKISGRLVGSAFVGYGDWYNQELLSDMAGWAGGITIHSSELKTAVQQLQDFTGEVGMRSPRQAVKLPVGTFKAFTLDSVVQTYTPDQAGNAVYVPATDRDYDLWALTQTANGSVGKEDWTPALYAAASILLPVKPYLAEDIVSILGDIYFIKRLQNAYTTEEYGELAGQLAQAAVDPDLQYVDGHKQGFKPDPNAFCVLDLVDLLMSDEDARFYPYHEDFRYKRIGPAAKTKEGYPTFEPDKSQGYALTNLVWNSTKLNLSMQVRISGTVDLGEEAEAVGLPQIFHTHITRNYSIISDGALWTTSLPVSLSKWAYEKLVSVGLVEPTTWYFDRVFTLNLRNLPIINRSIAELVETAVTGEQLAALAVQEEHSKARLKVYKKLLDDLAGDKSNLSDAFTDEQKAFLEAKGIKEYGFSPPTETQKTGDHLLVRTFDIQVSGFSSLPKVDEVKAKMQTKGKPLAASAQVMAEAIRASEVGVVLNPNQEEFLKESIAMEKKSQRRTREMIQRCKFSLMLGKRWFPDVDRENPVITVPINGGTKVTFKMGQAKVEI